MNVHEHELCNETHEDDPHPRFREPHCADCGERMPTARDTAYAAAYRQWADGNDER